MTERRPWYAAIGRGALGLLLGVLFVGAPPAAADVGVVRVSPTVASPGQPVLLGVGCGFCARPTSFSISLVPIAEAPRPHPCQGSALCAPRAAAPPHDRPFVLLGRTRAGRALLPGADPPGSESHLRFQVPDVQPGRYAFVIFVPGRGRAARGMLIAQTTRNLLRVKPREPAARRAENGGAPTVRVAAATGIVALVIGAVLLMRRRGAA
jgi:hypothetical protein